MKCTATTSHFLIILAVIFILGSCSEPAKEKDKQVRPVKAIYVSNAESFNKRSFPGKAKAVQEVNLSFNEGGTLIELPIKIGDQVKKGQLIAKLDPREFDAKYKSTKAELLRDEQNYLRAKALVGKGHISKTDFDLLQAKYAVSEANMDLAEKSLEDSTLEAPFAGQIADLYAENHQTIAKQQNIARLLDITQIEMVVQIPENAINLVPLVKQVEVEFDSFPGHKIPALIKEISNEASPETRTYPVTLIMQQPKEIEILPGMAGKAKGQVKSSVSLQNTINIPISALITQGNMNKSFVWIIDEKTKKVHKREVNVGELTLSGVAITQGLKPGDWVVVAGVHSLDEGEQVSILNQKDK